MERNELGNEIPGEASLGDIVRDCGERYKGLVRRLGFVRVEIEAEADLMMLVLLFGWRKRAL